MKYSATASFVVAILLFLLPFVEIKCNGQTLASNSGIGLAFGTDYKTDGEMKSLENFGNVTGETGTETKTEKTKGEQYIAALIALGLGVLGLIISLAGSKSGRVNMIIGILAALALIVVMFQIKSDIKDQSASQTNTEGFGGAVTVAAEFTTWYFLAIISFLAAAFFGYRNSRPVIAKEQPPRRAPQLPVENPGDQSNFPKSASESQLG